MTDTPAIFSGLKPSGDIHLGNYLGALKQWVKLQDKGTAYYCIMDLHAITVPHNPKELSTRTLDAAAMYMALGLDPEKSTLFVQSHNPAHPEMAWLLECITPYGQLSRMTQFKDKYRTQKKNVSAGLFSYPVLMAADILLYDANIVPIGDDQVQHLELTRDIAERFNAQFGSTFTLPECSVEKNTARIMSLTDPTKKMSKSEDEKGCIILTEEPDSIRKKIRGAVTDTEPVFSFTKSGPAVKNLLSIYKALSEEEEKDIEARFEGKGYKEFKESLADLVVEKLDPIRGAFKRIRSEDTDLRVTLARGAHKAQVVATQKLHAAKNRMGFV